MALSHWLPLSPTKTLERTELKLLAPEAFDHAAACERMRVDRNGSVLSILRIELDALKGGKKERASCLRLLTRVFEGRLRITDTPGRLRDGAVGVLLPDTPPEGARKVADDLATVFPNDDLTIDLYHYPESRGDDHRFDGEDPSDDTDGEWMQVDKPPCKIPPVAAADAKASGVDQLFVKPTPAWKRATDLTLGLTGLVISAPIIGLCAGLVACTSPGGAFFVQQREGKGGRRFNIYKLRTMRRDAEALKEALREKNEQDGPAFKMTRDPRVTRIGRLLRRLSIDELPQLLNVVRGDMSLVGPRPLPVEESQRCLPWQRQRLSVTPGLTCIWQVKGRNRVSFEEWARMDLRYIRRQSPLEDARLILQTAPALMLSKGPR